MLAAGRATRFGDDKRLARLPSGEPLLETSLRRALASGLPVVLCLRPGDSALAAAAQDLGAGICFCPAADDGMGATLAQGIEAVCGWDGVLVALGDMPDIRPETFTAVAGALARAPIARPACNGRPGHPVGFAQRFFPELARLRGDSGARSLLREHAELVTAVNLDDPGILRDVDTPQDLG